MDVHVQTFQNHHGKLPPFACGDASWLHYNYTGKSKLLYAFDMLLWIEPWWSSFPFTFWKNILLMVFLSHYFCLQNPKNELWWSPYPFSFILQILNMNPKHCYYIWNLKFANIQWHLLYVVNQSKLSIQHTFGP